jgi:hypothetical protein
MSGQIFDQLARLPNLGRVQPDRRLIQNQNRGIMKQRIGQPHPLAKSLGQMTDGFILNGIQPAAVQNIIDSLQPLGARHFAEPAAKIEIFAHLHFGIERDIFRQISQMFADLLGLMKDIKTIDGCPAAGWREIAGEDFERGRFSRAVGAEESDNLPSRHFERNMIHRQGLTVCLGQLTHRNHAIALCFSSPSPKAGTRREGKNYVPHTWLSSQSCTG